MYQIAVGKYYNKFDDERDKDTAQFSFVSYCSFCCQRTTQCAEILVLKKQSMKKVTNNFKLTISD